MYDPTLDFIFQFRKVILHSSRLKLGEIIIIPIFLFGSGTFFVTDVNWPISIECDNFDIILFTLVRSKMIRGYFLIQKINLFCSVLVNKNILFFKKFWKFRYQHRKQKQLNKISIIFPWISLGKPIYRIQRRGFRIEKKTISGTKYGTIGS